MAKNGPNPGQYQKVADLLKQINAESRALGLSEQARIKIEDEILSRRIKSGQALQTEINNAIKLLKKAPISPIKPVKLALIDFSLSFNLLSKNICHTECVRVKPV